MKKFTMEYTVYSFFFMTDLKFVLTVDARDLDEAKQKVLHHNRLAENILPHAVS